MIRNKREVPQPWRPWNFSFPNPLQKFFKPEIFAGIVFLLYLYWENVVHGTVNVCSWYHKHVFIVPWTYVHGTINIKYCTGKYLFLSILQTKRERAILSPSTAPSAPPREGGGVDTFISRTFYSPPCREGSGEGLHQFFINFLPLKCNFSLKIFVGYKKMLIFAPNLRC